MKKKTLISIFAIIAFAVIVFAIICFPPANEEWPIFVPRADRSDVGQTLTFSAEQMLANGQDCFVYVYDPELKVGRLGIFGGDTNEMSVYPLLICEPDWHGGQALCESMKGTFTAKIVDRVNIGFVEGMHIYNTFHALKDSLAEFKPQEVISMDHHTGLDGNNLQYYFGYLSKDVEGKDWNILDDGIGIRIVAGTRETSSNPLLSLIERFHRTAKRYFLNDEFEI